MSMDDRGDGTLDRVAKHGPFARRDFGQAHDGAVAPETMEMSGSHQVANDAPQPPPPRPPGVGADAFSQNHWTAARNDHAQAMAENEQAARLHREAQQQAFLERRKAERQQERPREQQHDQGWER